MSFELVDTLYRSRITILNILERNGYNTEIYRNFSPAEIQAMSTAIASANLDLPHRTEEGRMAHIIYMAKPLNRSRFMTTIADRMGALKIEQSDYSNHELIFMVNEALAIDSPLHNSVAIAWSNLNLRVRIFCIDTLVNNPLDHVLVPAHEIIPKEEHDALLTNLMVQAKSQLPKIKYHTDMIARCLNLVPGDIVKINRPSPSAGVDERYRVCVP